MMQFLRFALLALGLWAPLPTRAQTAANASAGYVVLEVNGGASWQVVGGPSTAARALTSIAVDAQISLDSAATLVLYGGNPKTVFRMTGPGSHTLAASAPVAGARTTAAAREALPEPFKNLRLNVPATAQASLVMRSASTERVRVLAPVGALLPGEAPRLKWQGAGNRAPFRLDIADWQGNLVAQGESASNEWTPELAQPLMAGTRYRFSVFGRAFGGKPGESDFGEFRVARETEAATIINARPADTAALYLKRLYAVRLRELRLVQAAEDYEQSIANAK
jgi:hypothetical protein